MGKDIREEERRRKGADFHIGGHTQERSLTECCRGKPFFGGDNVRYVDVMLGGMVSMDATNQGALW